LPNAGPFEYELEELGMARFFLICMAGAIGTAARYLVGIGAGRLFAGAAFPYGTFTVNVVGSFILAFVLELSLHSAVITPTLRLTLATGFCGGLTTYSSFNFESFRLMQEKAWGTAVAYVTSTFLGCLFAALLGVWMARRLVGPG
jgi:CrcB protein